MTLACPPNCDPTSFDSYMKKTGEKLNFSRRRKREYLVQDSTNNTHSEQGNETLKLTSKKRKILQKKNQKYKLKFPDLKKKVSKTNTKDTKIYYDSIDPQMQNSTKPFPLNLNPIFVDSTNWVLKKTIQNKKTLAKKYAKNNIFCAWHGQFCSKNNSAKYSPQVHGGEFNSRKSQKHQIKKKNQRKRKRKNSRNKNQSHICRNCIQLWRKWNASGNPIIKTLKERIKVFENEEDSESDEKTDSDGEYLGKEEEEAKTTNLCHNPSYNTEEMRIYLMAEDEKKKELAFQILEREAKEDQTRKGENQIS
ncbi:hypothetical protein M0813_28827 [Anaeramoeba flamelloides]|uniref:Uncharacterized protein n=1 Tax=Anaeramoeba flamelloides TaxID=1746091 RepID=A0ABQ8XQG8_9EUKA|nr:hypothetical protein M0813_28827 [Anaeramoeba flamelloides]